MGFDTPLHDPLQGYFRFVISFLWSISDPGRTSTMGSGASKKLQIVVAPANVTPFSSHQEYPVHITLQPRILQEKWLSRYREDDSCEESSSQKVVERDVSHTGTLTRYKMNYPEQAEDFQKVFENMQVLRNTMTNSSTRNDRYSKDVETAILNLLTICNDIHTSTGTLASKKMRVLDCLVEIQAAKLLQRLTQNYFQDFYEKRGKFVFFFLQLVPGTMHNITDFHDGFCSTSGQAGVVPMCLENIVRLDRENDNWQSGNTESEPLQLIGHCLGILHNISRRLRDRGLFPDSEETLLYFAMVKNSQVAPLVLLCLAYLVNEDSNHLISPDENLLCFIITLLNEAYQSKNRRWNEYSTTELAEGLSHLAINDNNKKILSQNGAIRVVTAILKTSNDDEETASGARALWMLAFDDTNKDVIRQQEGTLHSLRPLHHNTNPEVQKAAAGALWEIEGKKARNNADKTEGTTGNHVMISYQWDAQEVLVKVKNKLQASGYRVWMDLERMGGSTLEAMARAV